MHSGKRVTSAARIALGIAAAILLAGAGAVRAQPDRSSRWALPTLPPRAIHGQRVVVMVLLSGVSLSDLDAAPATAIASLMRSGAVGLMNARTAPPSPGRQQRGIDSLVLHPEEIRPTTIEAGCLTLGAGTRCFARGEAGEAFDAEERFLGIPAREWWAQRTGRTPGGDRVYQVSAPRLAAGQSRLRYPAAPGALGDALRLAGMPTAVVGNADDDSGPHREAACVAMDSLGRVPLGTMCAALSPPDPLSPGGRRTDADAVVAAAEAAIRAGARLVVVEVGDTARAERASDSIHASLRPQRRREAIARADRMVAGLLRRVDATRALFLIVTPAPSLDAARAGNPLTPVVMAGRGVERGLITSSSTRTPGLAANTDIAPTVLAFLGVPTPAQMVGRPLASVHNTRAVATALALEARFRRIEDYARPVMRWLVWVQVALLGAFCILAWARPNPDPVRSRPAQVGALAQAALPSALLLPGLLSPPSAVAGMAAFLAIDALLVAAACFLRRWISPAGLLFGTAAALLAGDTFTGSGLLRASPLGYSPYSGARYYGIGNEGFGWLIPAAVLALAFLWPGDQRPKTRDQRPRTGERRLETGDRRAETCVGRRSSDRAPSPRHPLTPSLLCVAAVAFAAAVLIGHPRLGANFGGALSAAATGAAAAAIALRGRLNRRLAAALLVAGLVFAALPVLFEVLAGGDRQSHIGRAFESVRSGGIGAAWQIASRKLGMNVLLLRRSPWSRLLLLAGVVLIYTLRRNGRAIAAQRPVAWGAAQAVLAGAAAALLFNDSGVLPAAEMVTAAMAAAILCVKELPNQDGKMQDAG